MTDPASSTPQTRPLGATLSPRMLIVFVVLAAAALGLAMVCLHPKHLSDEGFHAPQVVGWSDGVYRIERSLPMPPTYHALLGFMARAVGERDLTVLRFLSGVVSLLCLPAFARLTRRFWPDQGGLRAAHLFFLPLAFPFFFLLYTDLWSLLSVLGMLALTLERRYLWAGLAALFALALRQTAAVWLGFALVLVALDGCDTRATFSLRRAAENLFRRGYPLLFPACLFLVFVVLNKGVALGEHKKHGTGLGLTNLSLFLLVCWAVYLPLHVQALPRITPLLRKPAVLLSLGLGMLAYLGSYEVKHGWNHVLPDYFLHNGALALMSKSTILRAALYVPVAWAALSLLTMPFPEPRVRWLLLFIVPSVALTPIIEPRYYLPGLALLLAFRAPAGERVELGTLFAYAPVSAYVLFGTVKGSLFL